MSEIHKFSQRMDHIPFSGIRTIFEECSRLEAAGTDVVHLEIGRPDFDTPSPIKDAATTAIDQGHVHYTSNYGINSLREKIAHKFEKDNRVEYNPHGEIITTCGATEAILISVLTLVGPGDEVLIPDPSWTYAPIIRLAGGIPVRYDLDAENGFEPSLESIVDVATDRTSVLILNSPHNPTGGVVSDELVTDLATVATENDWYIISDEIYEKIIYDGCTHHSLAAEPKLYDRTVTVNGVSKAYSMTGWRLGYIGAPEPIVDGIIRARQYTTTCAPSIAQHAAVEAIGSSLHEPIQKAFAARRDLVMDRMDEIPGMDCPDPNGAFYAFPTLPHWYTDDTEFVFELLREAGVALVPGSVFGPAGNGRVRIAYSNSEARINEAFNRLTEWI